MKVIIIPNKNESIEQIERVIEHFVTYGYNDFILFSEKSFDKFFGPYLKYNKVDMVKINQVDTTENLLILIRGSLGERFMIVYTDNICATSVDKITQFHTSHGKMTTIVQATGRINKLSAVVTEPEILDYVISGESFERFSLKRAAEDCEIAFYNLVYKQ